MLLHIFNPSHDEALAANYPYYYPSSIARRLESEWAMLPALWASSGDCIYVPQDLSAAETADWSWAFPDVSFVRQHDLTPNLWKQINDIKPWGWDSLLRLRLRKMGAPESLLPSERDLCQLRQLSSRQTTTTLLPLLRQRLEELGIPTVGESIVVHSKDEWDECLHKWSKLIVKSLWSCSGRGVFRVLDSPTVSDTGRMQRLIRDQGGVEVEPLLLPVVTNFALEFILRADGVVHYEGVSLFSASESGMYAGNILASQTALRQKIEESLGRTGWLEMVTRVCCEILTHHLAGCIPGPLGIDMLITQTSEGMRLLPCVEVNLRRTMGHAALALWKSSFPVSNLPKALQSLWHTSSL